MKTVFLELLDVPAHEKGASLKSMICSQRPQRTHEVDVSGFAAIPKSPFAYWASAGLRRAFLDHPALQESALVASGTGTLDDFRFVRLWVECPPRERWRTYVKGGSHSTFYYDQHLSVNWQDDGNEMKAWIVYRYGGGHWARNIRSTDVYFRPGLTWPRRTQGGLSLRIMPSGCVIGDKGPGIYVEGDGETELLALCAVVNSATYVELVELQMAFGSYEVGVIQRTPVPQLSATDEQVLAALALEVWSAKQALDSCVETSHAFVLPALLQASGPDIQSRAHAWRMREKHLQGTVTRAEGQIDLYCGSLYGIGPAPAESPDAANDALSSKGTIASEGEPGTPNKTYAEELLSWAVGAAFGRFNIPPAGGHALVGEASTGGSERSSPFRQLPTASPGMLSGTGLERARADVAHPASVSRDGILVDDFGARLDLPQAVHRVLAVAIGDDGATWDEAATMVGGRAHDLRRWFARDFFAQHIKTYSKSRRKAPIYWQLATPSASYSVWLYIHRFTPDTLYRVLNDCIGPKLDHEQLKLSTMISDAGPEGSRTQRAEIAKQEAFVDELRAFKVEVERAAPLWNPDLNDGVVINFSLLWRLVPHNKSWQKEIRKVWRSLMAGDYDWSSLAMHLWPERVVLKCLDDRSLAIAHA